MTTTTIRSDTVTVNGTELYYELRGDGPSLMFVSGGFGDAAGWETTGGELAGSFTVLSYDRRGNSRSPRPAGWSTTSLDEQADDAAALLRALDLAPAAVYGNSLGADIALNLVLRHPGVVRHAILHEPGLDDALDDPDEAMAPFMEVMGPSIEAGDLRGAADALLRLACGDEAYRTIPADRIDRMLGNAETLLEIELAGEASIDMAALARCRVPLTVVVGATAPPFLTTGSRKLAELLQVEPVTVPGAHVPQLTHPHELARAITGILRPQHG